MTVKKIRTFRGIARDLSEAFGGNTSTYLKLMMKKAKRLIKAEKQMQMILSDI